MWYMAIGPSRVLARGRSRRIEKRVLRDQHERARRGLTVPYGRFVLGDFIERAANVDGGRSRALRYRSTGSSRRVPNRP